MKEEKKWYEETPGYEPPAQTSQPAFDSGTIDERPEHKATREREEAKAAEEAKKARTWGQFFSEIWHTIKTPFIAAVEALIGDKKKTENIAPPLPNYPAPPLLPKTPAPSAPPIPNYPPPAIPGKNAEKVLEGREASANDIGRGAAG